MSEDLTPIGEIMRNSLLGWSCCNTGREPDEGEYLVGEIIYCSKCHTPRQERLASDCKIDIECACQLKERLKVQESENERARRIRVEDMRRTCISDKSFREYRFEFDDGQSPRTTEICKRYVENFKEFRKDGKGLLLCGSVGTGKTFLAMCIANALIDIGYRVMNTSLSEVIRMSQDFDTCDYELAKLYKCDAIILDDLGTERTTDYAVEQSNKFIDTCYKKNIPFIVTTNLSPKGMDNVLEDRQQSLYVRRTFSRILERTCPIEVNDVKRRAIKAETNHSDMKKMLGI